MKNGKNPFITDYSRIIGPCNINNYYQLEWFDKYFKSSYMVHNITSSSLNYLTSVEGNASMKFIENVINLYPNE